MTRSGRGRGKVRLDAMGDVRFASGFGAVGPLGRELRVTDGAFIFFGNLGGWGERGEGGVDVEHGAVAVGCGNIACGSIGAVVSADVRRMGGEKGGKGLLKGE